MNAKHIREADEWVRKLSGCKSDVGRRLMLTFLATDRDVEMTEEARLMALCAALGCTAEEFSEAIAELERVGLVELKWLA